MNAWTGHEAFLTRTAARVRWWRGALIVAVVVACVVLAGTLTR